MITKKRVESDRLELRCLQPREVGESYLAWLNDPRVTQFLEVKSHPPMRLDNLKEYVLSVNDSDHSILFGIFMRGGRGHVGNIKIGPIDWVGRSAQIGVLIGETDLWGKGIARDVIDLTVEFAFSELKLKSTTAAFYESHVRSMSAFRKAGFSFYKKIANGPRSGGRKGEAVFVYVRNVDESFPGGDV